MSTKRSNADLAQIIRQAVLEDLDRRGIEHGPHGCDRISTWGVQRVAVFDMVVEGQTFAIQVKGA